MSDEPTVYRNYDQNTLDQQYSPSSCIDDIEVFLRDYDRFSEQARDEAATDASAELDLRYGPGDEEVLDFFRARTAALAPLHIYIHGGYWQLLSKNESAFAATMFQNNGCAFAAVNYTLCPEQTLTGIVAENRRAIKWLYDHAQALGVDPERISISGSSAGAHLCAMMLLTDWHEYGLPNDVIKFACAMSGIYDLEPIRLTYVNDKVDMDEEEAHCNSPLLIPPRHECPVMIVYGDNETDEFKRQSDDYAHMLRRHSKDVTLREIENRNHFDIVFDLMHNDTWLTSTLLEHISKGHQAQVIRHEQ